MINIGGDDGATCGHFVTDKLGRDVLRQTRAKTFTRMLVAKHFAANTLTAHIFANGDKFHFRGHNTLARIMQLRHAFA
ncbi:hypothetical protein D3C78_1672490 [compost metagenome]